MNNRFTLPAYGYRYTRGVVPITGDRLLHPEDRENDLARIVQRWGRHWAAATWPAKEHFAKLGRGSGDPPLHTDADVAGWIFLNPAAGSLAEQVRTGEVDVATALSAEAEAWGQRH